MSSSPYSTELLAELSEKVQLLMEENGLLVDQKHKLAQELDTQADLLDSQRDSIDHLSGSLNHAEKELQKVCKLQQVIEAERDEAVKQTLTLSEALGRAEEEIDILNGSMDSLQEDKSKAAEEVQRLTSQVKLLSSRYSTDQQAIWEKVRYLEQYAKEQHHAKEAVSRELDACQEVLRKLRAEYKVTRQDAEGMLTVMTGMEKQLNDYSSREDSIHQMGQEAREKVEEALIVKEAAAIASAQAAQEIARLQAERKELLVVKEQEIMAAVDEATKGMLEMQRALERELEEAIKRNAELLCTIPHVCLHS